MEIGFVLVDVFADQPFAGNQLCVVPEPPPGLDADAMLTLTREIGFSETTFVTATRPGGYAVRIFTPGGEVPFAGHPTLGTAAVLAARGLTGTGVVQTSAAGDVPVQVDLARRTARMRQLPPTLGPAVPDRAGVAAAAGLTPAELVDDLPVTVASTGLPHTIVPVRDEPALRRARRDGPAVSAVCERLGTESLYLVAVRREGEVVARMFDRDDAIGEDPATGSAAGPLGAYLAEHGLAGAPGRIDVHQGEQAGRPSRLLVDVEPSDAGGWLVHVGGGVHVVGEGAFHWEGTVA